MDRRQKAGGGTHPAPLRDARRCTGAHDGRERLSDRGAGAPPDRPWHQPQRGWDVELEVRQLPQRLARSEEHTSELQSLMRISYAVFCLKKKTQTNKINT